MAIFSALFVTVCALPEHQVATATALPLPFLTDSGQMITVTSTSASATIGELTAWEKNSFIGPWKPVIGPVPANLGELGIGAPADNVYRTPAGTFLLDQAFGRQTNPGTKMPYFVANQRDWWDSNMKSPTYNTHVAQENSPGGDSENLYNSGPVYDYAVNIAHNPERIPGRASAIFLHVSAGEPTWGCVAINKETMIKILQWLDPAQHPRIEISTQR